MTTPFSIHTSEINKKGYSVDIPKTIGGGYRSKYFEGNLYFDRKIKLRKESVSY